MHPSNPKSGVYMPLATASPWPSNVPPDNHRQAIFHSRHQTTRDRIILLFGNSYYPAFQKRAQRIGLCQRWCKLIYNQHSNRLRYHPYRCGDSFCPTCGPINHSKLAAHIESLVMKLNERRHLVLTPKSNDQPLKQQFRRLRYNFERLRRTRFWKTHCTGGVYCLHATRNLRKGQWHPHLHALIGGDYMLQKELVRLWKEVSGDSCIVWIGKPEGTHAAARELANYVGRPVQLDELPDAAILEYAENMIGVRKVQTFGCLHGQPKADKPKVLPDELPERQVDTSHVIWLNRLGCRHAAELLILISQRWPSEGRYIAFELPDLEIPPTVLDVWRSRKEPRDARGPPPAVRAARDAEIQKLEPELGRIAALFFADEDQGVHREAELDNQITRKVA